MTVFISYRRSTSKYLALNIFRELRARGYDAFLDINSIDSGQFDRIILHQIAARPHFLVLLSAGSLERCANEGDWLRREIEEAFRLKRNIVPIFDEGFNLELERQFLPEPIRSELPRLNAAPYSFYYHDAFIDNLCNRFLKRPAYDAVIAPTPVAEVNEVRRRIEHISRTIASEGLDKPIFTLPLLEWIDIPAGKVRLEDKTDRYSVAPFAIAKYPVTNAQFQAFIADGGYEADRYWIDLAGRETAPAQPQWTDPTHPRETVNWYEAIAFSRWLAEKTGLPVTLPTEMQWQWAAIGDKGWAYPYGNIFDAKKSNTSESRIGQTTAVDRYPKGASAFGVMDMSGNVWEWCLNEYSMPQRVGIPDTQERALRGGSWSRGQYDARAFSRTYSYPGFRDSLFGFRVAVVRPFWP